MGAGDWAAVWTVAFVTGGVVFYLRSRRKDRDHLRAVEEWARARGLTFRLGAAELAWVYSLPRRAEAGTKFQVDGVAGGHPFTLAYVAHSYGDSDSGGIIELTIVVLHLRNAYAATELDRRRAEDPVGHAAFDRRFRVRTDVPGGPSAAVSPALAEAMIAEDLPRWSLRERELLCFADGRHAADRLDDDVRRAVRVAGLLGVR